MGEWNLAKAYAAILGVILVLVGLLGFISNPVVGDSGNNPILVTGVVHNLIHLLTGFLFLYVAFALRGEAQASAVIAIGGLYIALLLLTLISPTLFGILNYPVDLADHALHLLLGALSIGVGYVARSQLAMAR